MDVGAAILACADCMRQCVATVDYDEVRSVLELVTEVERAMRNILNSQPGSEAGYDSHLWHAPHFRRSSPTA